MKRMKDRLLSVLTAAMILIVYVAVPGFAVRVSAVGPVKYLVGDNPNNTCTSYTSLTPATSTWSGSVNDGWYVVEESVEIPSRITVSGDVKLILVDGKKLTASNGISVTGSNKLTIYAQTSESTMGVLTADASKDHGVAGIGGDFQGSGGNITINGGIVTAYGGNGNAAFGGGAGIGGGNQGAGGTITINGGEVTAIGGYGTAASGGGAGIGGGEMGAGGTITINGGEVTAYGCDWGSRHRRRGSRIRRHNNDKRRYS